MERSQQRSEITNSSILHSNDVNCAPLNLQLNHGISNNYPRKKHDNVSIRSPTTGESTEAEDDDHEDCDTDEPSNNQKDLSPPRRPIICAVCNLPPRFTGVSTGPGPMLTCSHGHLLCQQCVQRYAVCSDISCMICGAELYASTSNYFRVTNCSSSRFLQPQTSCGDSRGIPIICNAIRSVREVEDHPKLWSQNYGENGVTFVEENPRGYSSMWERDSGDAMYPSNLSRLQNQQRSSCNVIRSCVDGIDNEETQKCGSCARDGSGNAALVQSDCSRRPIRCPRLDCAVNVAFSALTHHFLFDHPEVPILSIEPGMKSTLIVSFEALSCDSSRCLALLLVSGKLTGAAARLFNGNQIQPRYRNRLPLPVLAARLHCSNQNSPEKDRALGEGQSQSDVVIAWVAGLDVGGGTTETLRCSIQALDGSDNGGLRSLTYTGPVNSLRTVQSPREILKTGDCVILHQGLINHITSGCSSLNVTVIVH